ncbi:MAG: glutaminyl-peptide cyclotransferase [Bacteroidota bacterium]
MKFKLIVFVVMVASLHSCRNEEKSTEQVAETPAIVSIENIAFNLKSTFPHDTLSFTEGFLVHKGQFLESTGSPSERPQAESLIGILNTKTGKLDVKAKLDKSIYFGEGIVIVNDKLYQLTYKNQQGFIYDANTFKKLGDFKYANPEGWGLTTDGKSIIMSDGSSSLTYLDPKNLQPIKTVTVKKYGAPITMINELEYINGFIYGNIWQTNEIVKINPATGDVVGKLDLTPINSVEKTDNPRAMEMNGIAYDAATKKVYVTGKMWSKVYEIAF